MTNKSLKLIAIGASLIAVSIVAYYIYDTVKYSYHIEWGIPESVVWIFADSARKDMDLQFASAAIRKTDRLYQWRYHSDLNCLIQVWEIKALSSVDPDTVPIHTDVFLNKVSLRGEILDKGSPAGETQVKFGPFFNGKMEIDLDENSKIIRMFEGKNYRGFYGTVGRMAFENGHGQILCMQDYKAGNVPMLFAMYKARKSFYLIFISADRPFSENMIHILNLK